MRIWGKVIGGIFGFMVASSLGLGLLGFIAGIWLGSQFDHGLEELSTNFDDAFFYATFATMGYIAKSDGRISENEIRIAKTIMQQMQLNIQQRELAMAAFKQGKQRYFDINPVLLNLRRHCQMNLLHMFIEIQFQSAYADGLLANNKKQILHSICQQLGFSLITFENLYHRFESGQTYSKQSYSNSSNYSEENSKQDLQTAYQILGVASTVSDAEIKRAYRRLMSQHHPDKLSAKGLSDAMLKIATKKTQDIKAAYEKIKKSRGIR